MNHRHLVHALCAVAAVATAACHRQPTSAAPAGQFSAQQPVARPAARPAAQAPANEGPTTLSTVGLGDGPALTHVQGRNGDFRLADVDGLKTLELDGKPVSYTDGTGSQLVQANNDLTLLGVFELPTESVAWVMITGGTACPATQLLVSARTGQFPRVVSVDGCDDRVTIAKSGAKLRLEVGGRPAVYHDGQLLMGVSD